MDLLDAVKSCLKINLESFKSKLVLAQHFQLTGPVTYTTHLKFHTVDQTNSTDTVLCIH